MLIKIVEFRGDRIINRLGWFLSELAVGSQSKILLGGDQVMPCSNYQHKGIPFFRIPKLFPMFFSLAGYLSYSCFLGVFKKTPVHK